MSDEVIGGAGADTFVLDTHSGIDTIRDLNGQQGDRLAFRAYFDVDQFTYNRNTGALSYGDRTYAYLRDAQGNAASNFSPQTDIQIVNVGAYTLALEARFEQLNGRSAPAFNAVEIGGISIPHLFDEGFYLNENADVAAAVKRGVLSSGYDHFVQYGWQEGRDPSSLYNEDHYLTHYGDVAAAVQQGAFRSGLQHFLLYGHKENRSGSAQFDAADYLAANQDVKAAIDQGRIHSAFEHYAEYGMAEGRASGLIFDEQYYSLRYGTQRGSGLEEFAYSLGQHDVSPNDLFDESQYLNANADVSRAVARGVFDSGFEHYIEHGRFEAGRAIV